ncbi:MAG: CvpA family protein [Armatimonadota bacterium]|nr:CvpA family protein [Armatimonadota bacterium]
MSWLDWAIVAILLWAILRSVQGGWPRAVSSLVGIVTGVWAAFEWSPYLAQGISQVAPIAAPWSSPAAFLLLVGAGDVTVGTLGSILLRPPSRPTLPQRFVAASLGFLRGIVLSGVFLAILLGSPLEPLVSKDVQKSRLAPFVVKGGRLVMEYLRQQGSPGKVF